ncbi:MAG: carboxypeptidase-like regulatory domain-containing protein, partial [Chitinophagaceae bacterium]
MNSSFLHAFLLFSLVFFTSETKAFTQDPLAKKISLNIQDQEIKKILTLIEKQAATSFAYSSVNTSLKNKVSIQVEQKPIASILNILLRNTGLTYSVSGEVIILHKKPGAPAEVVEAIPDDLQHKEAVFLPPITVSGSVFDESGTGLSGVSIVYKGTSLGTTTSSNGNYSFNLPDDNGTLIISYVGFTTQEVPVGGRRLINITLVPDAK